MHILGWCMSWFNCGGVGLDKSSVLTHIQLKVYSYIIDQVSSMARGIYINILCNFKFKSCMYLYILELNKL